MFLCYFAFIKGIIITEIGRFRIHRGCISLRSFLLLCSVLSCAFSSCLISLLVQKVLPSLLCSIILSSLYDCRVLFLQRWIQTKLGKKNNYSLLHLNSSLKIARMPSNLQLIVCHFKSQTKAALHPLITWGKKFCEQMLIEETGQWGCHPIPRAAWSSASCGYPQKGKELIGGTFCVGVVTVNLVPMLIIFFQRWLVRGREAHAWRF